MNRPLGAAAAAFVAGILSSAYGFFAGITFPSCLFIASCILAAVIQRPGRWRVVPIYVCFFASGAFLWNVRSASSPEDELSLFLSGGSSQTLEFEGRVRTTEILLPNESFLRFVLDVEHVYAGNARQDITGRALVRWSNPSEPVYVGDRVRVSGVPRLDISRLNPGVRGIEDQLHLQGVRFAVQCSGPDAARRSGPGPWWVPTCLASRLRQAQADRLASGVPESVLPFVAAVWLGHRSSIAQNEYQSYIESGTAHILAVSGIHVGIVFISAGFLIGLLVRSPRRSALCVLSVVALFTLMAGARPSVLRAAMMVAIYVAADFFERERDAPTALSIAAILLLAWNPFYLLNTGFQLSFLSVASILMFHKPLATYLKERWRLERTFSDSLSTTVAAQILPMPIAVRAFHVLPWAAPLANLLIIPLLGIVLWLCLITSVLAWIYLDSAALFGHALLPVIFLIRWIAGAISSVPFAHASLVSPAPLAMAAYWAAVAVLALPCRPPMARLRFPVAALLLALAFAVWRPAQPPEIVFLDVGHGDATFVRWPDKTTLLVDGGDASPFMDMGAAVVAPFLWSNGVSRLDYIVATHPDRDHVGGLTHVLERFPVGCLILGPENTEQPLESGLLSCCLRRGIPVLRVERGDILPVGDGCVEVLHPVQGAPYSSINDSSLVLRVTWCGVRLLLPGDIQHEAEAQVAALDCQADILKVPHHGSANSSSEVFIDAVRPRVAVISTGGSFGRERAAAEVVERYLRTGASVFRTDMQGGIRITLNHDGVRVQTQRPMAVSETAPAVHAY